MLEHTKDYLTLAGHWIYVHSEQVFGGVTGVAVGYKTGDHDGGLFSDIRHVGFIFLCGFAGAMGGTLWKMIVKWWTKRKNNEPKIS